MNKLLIVFFFLLFSTDAFAQKKIEREGFYYGVGYTQSFLSPTSLNYIIKRYNQKNQSAFDTPMDSITTMNGFSNVVSYVKNSHVTDFTIEIKGKKVSSIDIKQNTDTEERQLKIGIANIGFGYGYMFARNLTAGAGIDMNIITAKTRANSMDNVSTETWVSLYDEVKFGYRFYLDYLISTGKSSIIIFNIRPYYQITPEIEMAEISKGLNSSTTVPASEDIKGNLNNFGISITFGVGVIRHHKNQGFKDIFE